MLVTLARRPDLAEAVYAIPYPPGSPSFMAGSLASLLVRGRRVARRWPHLVVALLDGDRPIARGVMVPFRGRGPLPARGWDEVAVWAAEDALDDVVPDTACALEIAVHPEHQGRGHSGTVLVAMREAAGQGGGAVEADARVRRRDPGGRPARRPLAAHPRPRVSRHRAMRPKAALVASDAPKAALGASDAPKATLGRLGRPPTSSDSRR